MQMLGEGGGGVQPLLRTNFVKIFKVFLTFSRGQIIFTKNVPYDARSLNKIGCKKRLFRGGGGDQNPKVSFL